jgi:hypothetical protein
MVLRSKALLLTLYIRTVLGITVPKVLFWSGKGGNSVEYILMEEALGTQLGEVWDTMDLPSEAENCGGYCCSWKETTLCIIYMVGYAIHFINWEVKSDINLSSYGKHLLCG